MKFKSVMSLLVTCVLVVTMGTGCGSKKDTTANKTTEDNGMQGNMYKTGLPIVKDKVTLKAAAAKYSGTCDFSEIETFKDLEAKTNVHIEWDMLPQQGFSEKKGLLLASNDLPDIFFGTAAGGITEDELTTYGAQGVFQPLEKAIDTYATNIKALFQKLPDAKRVSASADGHIYSLPFVQEMQANTVYTRMFINKVWLDRLKLSVPKTTDEFANVLRAFKTRDPNGNGKPDEIPLAFMGRNNNNGHFGLYAAFGVLDSSDHMMLKDKKVVFTPTMNEYKDAVKWLSSLYKEDLVDKEAFTHDLNQYKALGQQSDILFGVYFDWGGTAVVGADRYKQNYVPLAPLKGPKGDQLWPTRPSAIWSGNFVVTSANKNLDISIRWADMLYDEKVSMQLQYGPLGINLKEENGKVVMLDPPAGMSINDFRYSRAPAITACAITADMFNNKMVVNQTMKADDAIYQVYAPYLPKDYLPTSNLKFTKEQSTKLSSYKADIYTYANNMEAKWICGDSSIDADWDNAQKEMKKMGVEDLVKIYQTAYDAYMKN